jgi:uncharacterized protein (DUF433 family)
MTDSVIQGINYIAKTEGFRRGEPHFTDRHLAVEIVVDAIVNHGASVEEMMRSYELTAAQVHAALAYYYDHVGEFEAMWAETDRIEAEHEARMTPEDHAFRERMLDKLKARREERGED